MKVICNFDNLAMVLSNIALVVEDALSSEDMKNVIMRVHKQDTAVELIGVNQMITYRVALENGSYSVEAADEEYGDNGVIQIQLKSKELNSFLGAFKTMHKTKVTEVEFETIKNKISVTVVEEDIESGVQHRANWLFDSIPIKANMLPSINIAMPEETETLDVVAMMLYTSSLFPVMTATGNLYSKLVFSENHVVAFSTAFTVMMKNFLTGVFSNLTLSYRALSFMKSVVCNEQLVEVAKTDERICLRMGNAVAFIRFDTKTPNYALYESMIQKNHAIVLDRQYFKDVLKRLSLVNESVQFSINYEDGVVEVRNSKFHQELPILQTKAIEELGNVSFKILPEVFNKAIIGDDAAFSQLVFIYFEPQEKGGYNLIFADDSGSWNSVARVH